MQQTIIVNEQKELKNSQIIAALTKTIAILLSTTPETPLGKFLKLCLETKVDTAVSGKTP